MSFSFSNTGAYITYLMLLYLPCFHPSLQYLLLVCLRNKDAIQTTYYAMIGLPRNRGPYSIIQFSAKVYWKIIFSHKKVISQGHATRISMLFTSSSMIDWSKKREKKWGLCKSTKVFNPQNQCIICVASIWQYSLLAGVRQICLKCTKLWKF